MISFIPLFAALIGFISALSGVFIANKFNERRFLAQVSYEQDKASRALLLSKAEDLHLHILRWSKALYGYQFHQISFAQGNISQEAVYNHLESMNSKDDHDKVETLLNLYFVELVPHMKSIRNSLSKANEIYSSCQKVSRPQEKLVLSLFECSEELECLFNLILEDLRKTVRKLVHLNK